MTAKEIATTLQEATEGKEKSEVREIVGRLVTYLANANQSRLLPLVLGEAEKILAAESPTLLIASDEEATRLKNEIVEAILKMGARSAPHTTTDPSLISGFILSYQGKRIDCSGKRHLIDLYATLTA